MRERERDGERLRKLNNNELTIFANNIFCSKYKKSPTKPVLNWQM